MALFKERYFQVLYVLVKYGFDELIASTPLKDLIVKIERPKKKMVIEHTRAERIRMAIEELGVTFIKFAQILSTRPDIVPGDFLNEFTKLQDRVAPVEMDVRDIIETTFGKGVDDLFQHVDEYPVACASTAQAYKAKLVTGEEVVLKVIKPGIQERVKADIDILQDIAGFLARYSEDPTYQSVPKFISAFEQVIKKEMNLSFEAMNIERFRKLYGKTEGVYIPKIYKEYCQKNILCIELIEGAKVDKDEQLKDFGIDGKDLALRGIGFYIEQIFKRGYYHADPHPGNIFINKEKEICLIDFGMMGEIMPEDKDLISKLMISLYEGKIRESITLIKKIAISHQVTSERQLEYDLYDLISYFNFDLKDIDVREVLGKTREIIFTNKIELPRHFFLLFRVITMLDGLGRRLYPKYNLLEHLEPHIYSLAKERFSFKNMRRRAVKKLQAYNQLIDIFPESAYEIIEKLKAGELKISMEHKGLDKTVDRFEKVSNRAVLSLILGSLIIGSSLLMAMDVPPLVFEISAFGLVGYMISGVIGLFIIYKIIRKKGF